MYITSHIKVDKYKYMVTVLKYMIKIFLGGVRKRDKTKTSIDLNLHLWIIVPFIKKGLKA